MKYADFKKAIHELVCSAAEDGRRAFALDTIRLLHESAKSAINSQFTEAEFNQLTKILSRVADGPFDELKRELEDLLNSQCEDPVRAIEFDSVVTELLCAVDHWIDYRLKGNPDSITGVAINMVNHVDYCIGGDGGGYSIDNMLGAPAMVAEYQRQQTLLTHG